MKETLFIGESVTISNAGDALLLNFSEDTIINRITINEEEAGGIQTFHLEVFTDGSWKTVYDNDYIGPNRICILPEDITTTGVRLVADTISGDTVITAFTADLQEKKENPSFMNVGYIALPWCDMHGYAMNTDHINTLTDLILINNFVFDEQGEFYVTDHTGHPNDYFSKNPEEAGKAKSLMDGWVAKVKSMCVNYAEGRCRPWISLTAINPEAKVSAAFEDQHTREVFCDKVARFAVDYDMYGVDVDWEYPNTEESLSAFRKFMVTLADTLHKYNLKCAGTICPAYKHFYTAEMYEKMDYLSWMTYTRVTKTDTVTAQIPFYYMQELLNYSISVGCDPSKIWVGLPYFGRPYAGKGNTHYMDLYYTYYVNHPDAGAFPQGINCLPNRNGDPFWYNGVYLIRDKVAYAAENGFAGMMSWWIAYDIPVFRLGETKERGSVTFRGEDSLIQTEYSTIRRFTGVDTLPK